LGIGGSACAKALNSNSNTHTTVRIPVVIVTGLSSSRRCETFTHFLVKRRFPVNGVRRHAKTCGQACVGRRQWSDLDTKAGSG
jgi:hypothetical protein